jgi:hypothetical protein
MKKLAMITLSIAVTAVLFFSCDLLSGPVSAERRLELFADDLVAGNYSSLVDHLSQSATTMDINAINATFWDNTKFADVYGPTGITQNSSSSAGDVVTIDATLVTATDDFPYTFSLSPDASGDYYIYQIYDEDKGDYDVRKPVFE